MTPRSTRGRDGTPVRISADGVTLDGDLTMPEAASGIVLFAHGSGRNWHSSRNRFVAGTLPQAGLTTLLMDLLTADEERIFTKTTALRINIDMLAEQQVIE